MNKNCLTDWQMRRMLSVHIQSMSIDKLEVLAQMIIGENIYYDERKKRFMVNEWRDNGQRSDYYSIRSNSCS